MLWLKLNKFIQITKVPVSNIYYTFEFNYGYDNVTPQNIYIILGENCIRVYELFDFKVY